MVGVGVRKGQLLHIPQPGGNREVGSTVHPCMRRVDNRELGWAYPIPELPVNYRVQASPQTAGNRSEWARAPRVAGTLLIDLSQRHKMNKPSTWGKSLHDLSRSKTSG